MPIRRAVRCRAPPPAGAGSSEGSRRAGLGPEPSIGTTPTRRRPRSTRLAGAGSSLHALVGGLDPLGDPRPGEALGRAPRLGAETREPLRVQAEVAELLGEALRVGRRDEDPVDPVGDDVVVAGDVRGDDRRPGRERLGQDHAEALAGERRGAEDVGVVKRSPQLLARDAAEGVDQLAGLGVGEVAVEVARRRRRSASAAPGRARPAPGRRESRTGSPLRSSGRPTKRIRSSSDGGFGPVGAAREVDAVRDHLVLAAEPAPAGPGGRLGDRDPRAAAG